ncbi:hypothetical protein FRC03_002770 [Tulasnella sp. 419]|nr:hypothetical protein FRC03_002770 [Tulasnella sp. 419]
MSLPAQPVSALSLRQRVRSSKWIPQTRVMMAISPQLSNFERDHTSNLFSLCPNHHGEYGSGEFALLPRPTAREQLRNYEEADFAARQAHANAQNEILGRTLPFLLCPSIEYIPLQTFNLNPYLHIATVYDPQYYHFDNGTINPRPVIPFGHASPFALMYQ